jgi:hypothetical protein
MYNDSKENNINNIRYPPIVNKTNSNNNKIKFVEEEPDNSQLSNVYGNTSLNPFTIAIDMWQNYMNLWSNAYRQLLFKDSPIVNSEFLFVYWKSGQDKSKENKTS